MAAQERTGGKVTSTPPNTGSSSRFPGTDGVRRGDEAFAARGEGKCGPRLSVGEAVPQWPAFPCAAITNPGEPIVAQSDIDRGTGPSKVCTTTRSRHA